MQKKILVVDNDRTTAAIIEMLAVQLGHKVVAIAYSAQVAIDTARKLQPDLVLMDIRLGAGADGVDVALVINKYLNTPIVFVTAHSDDKTLRRAKMVNPAGFINKPIRESDLKTTLELALSPKQKEILHRQNNDISIADALKDVYQLTPAEIRVTQKLIKYPELHSIANVLNICISTVRTHLKHIYSKTNTNSQAMLIRELQIGPVAKFINK